MAETKPTRTVRRGRLYPERTMSQEEINQWHAERAAFRQHSKVVFDRVQPELIKTHYNWYMAVEPDSGDYFIDKDELVVAKIAHQKHPNARLHVFRINETGVCGTI
ncbi:hypothetical protein [Argonema antarcticum]|uniref:hypothetical protein n=1 Tax=Argonema antarcticum TaxID=2942763 RepID=UPI0020118235|nr:hypothetical protein [Argonema antarcticum]MCL1470960.1 hypothetical protein [Argonema antarcticum A004/B2]